MMKIFIPNTPSILFLMFFCLALPLQAGKSDGCMMIIDAGSSGSRLHTYLWHKGDDNNLKMTTPKLPDGSDLKALKISPGLSTFAHTLAGVPVYYGPMVDQIKNNLKLLKINKQSCPLRIYATAGLRLLPKKHQASLMQTAKKFFQSKGVVVSDTRVLSGVDEGLFAWIMVNYAAGKLGGPPLSTLGIVELGGASLQLAFVPFDYPKKDARKYEFAGVTYRLYVMSLNGFGLGEAHQTFKPEYVCNLPKKSSKDRGRYRKCRAAIAEKVFSKCSGKSCDLKNLSHPELAGNFIAIDNLQKRTDYLSTRDFSSAFLDGFGLKLCAKSLKKLSKVYPMASRGVLKNTCFDLGYMSVLLSGKGTQNRGLGFARSGVKINRPASIQGFEVSWALGAAIYALQS